MNTINYFLKCYSTFPSYKENHALLFDENGLPLQIINTRTTTEDQQKLNNFCFKYFKEAITNNDKKIINFANHAQMFNNNKKEFSDVFSREVGKLTFNNGQERALTLGLILHSPLLALVHENTSDPIPLPITSKAMDAYLHYSQKRLDPNIEPGLRSTERLSDVLLAISVAHYLGDENLVDALILNAVFEPIISDRLSFFNSLTILLDSFSDGILMTMQDAIARIIQGKTPTNNPIAFFNELAEALKEERTPFIYKIDLQYRPVSLELLELLAEKFPNLRRVNLKRAYLPANFTIPEVLRIRFQIIE